MFNTTPMILRVALPIPLRRSFDYLLPNGCPQQVLLPGVRIRVPFRKRDLIGILLEVVTQSPIALARLKPALAILDQEPLVPADILQFCHWAADYYHHPLGEVLANALPTWLRQGKAAVLSQEVYWCLTGEGQAKALDTVTRAPKQAALLQLFKQNVAGLTAKQLRGYSFTAATLKALEAKGWLTREMSFALARYVGQQTSQPLVLNPSQQSALQTILHQLAVFKVFLLEGVTGSGKTEVYLQAITQILRGGQQVLVLVPEIGLTPQTIMRFQARFLVPVVALHSGLSDKERLNAWLLAKNNQAKIVIGTRSALFTPFAALGLIVVDEEHDLSFKQQDGFRYHARDLAIVRARLCNIPIVLGSATPSLEVIYQALQGRYIHLVLPHRAGKAMLPIASIIDMRKQTIDDGLSDALCIEMAKHLASGNQVMVFLNRRGYAPVLMCHACGWFMKCHHCDARMTYHCQSKRVQCHHCGARKPLPRSCVSCHSSELLPLGLGTERLELVLKKKFPQYQLVRIDRDTTQCKGDIETLLANVQAGHYSILLGTQMLAKGHHFPNVTLVAVIDADSGLFSTDFRSLERMGQLLLQVSGRAGRVEQVGNVFIQTHHPELPQLRQLFQQGYADFASVLLQERQQAQLPPYVYFALVRAEAKNEQDAMNFLTALKASMQTSSMSVQLLGPTAAPMLRKAGYYRAQLLMQAKQRSLLHGFLKKLTVTLDKTSAPKIRWSLDVDPVEMY